MNRSTRGLIFKLSLTDKMKRSFFQAVVVSILLYGCTTGTLTKQLKKKLDGNYTRMLRAILNKSWCNTPQDTNYTATCLPSRKLYKSDEPDTQDTAGETRTNSSLMYSYGPPHMAKQKQDDQFEHIYSSYVRIHYVALKTNQKRWMIGKSGERGSGISVLAARHDDDDDDDFFSTSISGALRWLQEVQLFIFVSPLIYIEGTVLIRICIFLIPGFLLEFSVRVNFSWQRDK